tara:strand:- start:1208 stop:2113 length:906 start_codon:yes stop_codon:yes gene_type:complete
VTSFSKILFALFVGFTVAGCSDSPNSGGDLGNVDIPAFQKGLSTQDQNEFLQATSQARALLNELQVSSGLFGDALVLIINNGKLTKGNPDQRSTEAEYQNEIRKAFGACQIRSKTINDTAAGVTHKTQWLSNAKANGAQGEDCTLSLNATSRQAKGKTDLYSTLSQNTVTANFSWDDRTGTLKNKDLVSFTVSSKTNGTSVAANPMDQMNRSRSNQSVRYTLTLKYKDGSEASIDVSQKMDSSSHSPNDQRSEKNLTNKTTFVFKGTRNPVVFERTETANGDDSEDVMTLNGEEIYNKNKK